MSQDDARERMEEELEAWKRRYDELAGNSHVVISRVDLTGRVLYVSPSVRAVLGYDPEELVGQPGFAVADPADEARLRAALAESLRSGVASTVTSRVRRKDGSYVWMENRADALRDASGALVGFQSISHDVTARRDAEETLRLTERHHESFLRAMPVPAIVRHDETVLLVNDAFTSVFGWTEEALRGRPVLELIDAADRAYIQQRMSLALEERSIERSREHRLRHVDGTTVVVDVTVVPVFFRGAISTMILFRDLRERKQLEAQLVTADRMAALGRLAASVGHEIRNPLAYVLASVPLLERELDQLEPGEHVAVLRELVANVREGAQRIRAVAEDLRVLSRERSEPEPVDLRRLLDVTAAMAGLEVRRRARLVTDYGDLPAVTGSEARLGQVFVNLLVNAAQSIPEGDPEKNEVRIEARATKDATVVVDVVDTGRGIPEEIAARVFEPFFTTKSGEGTGLGLSISQHIVHSYGGTIAVVRGDARGTRLRVVLPCAAALPPSARDG